MTAAFEMTLETLSLNRPYLSLSEGWSVEADLLFNSTGFRAPQLNVRDHFWT